MGNASPPGRRGPGPLLGLGWLLAEPWLFPRWRERYGNVFMLHATGFGVPLVVVADPTEAKRIFAGDAALAADHHIARDPPSRFGIERDEHPLSQLAGHETTATALAWSIERLLRHPRALKRLRIELAEDSDRHLGPRGPGVAPQPTGNPLRTSLCQ
jgi:cytochrome P450